MPISDADGDENLPFSLGNQIIIVIFAKETYGFRLLNLV